MSDQEKKIGFIGGGNMGEAMLGALIHSGLYRPDQIQVSDVSTERLETLAKTYGIQTGSDNVGLFSACGTVVLAVKPQQMGGILSQIVQSPEYGIRQRKLVISIAAGIPIHRIETALYAPLDPDTRKKLPIIRVMPNTPALVLAGISGMSPNAHAAPEDLRTAQSVLEAMGRVIVFKEKDLDAVTALSGSGPAYVFYLIEAMIQAGILAGLTPEDASALTISTVEGSVKLLKARNESPESLRRKVTSPGGTTEAALNIMEKNQVKEHMVTAILAAARRAGELSQ
jgi:pyrroline-5-carboxylate reductase